MVDASVHATRGVVGAYALWLVAVVLLVVGRHTPVPLLPGVYGGLVGGALAFFCLGCVRLGRRAIAWLR